MIWVAGGDSGGRVINNALVLVVGVPAASSRVFARSAGGAVAPRDRPQRSRAIEDDASASVPGPGPEERPGRLSRSPPARCGWPRPAGVKRTGGARAPPFTTADGLPSRTSRALGSIGSRAASGSAPPPAWRGSSTIASSRLRGATRLSDAHRDGARQDAKAASGSARTPAASTGSARCRSGDHAARGPGRRRRARRSSRITPAALGRHRRRRPDAAHQRRPNIT